MSVQRNAIDSVWRAEDAVVRTAARGGHARRFPNSASRERSEHELNAIGAGTGLRLRRSAALLLPAISWPARARAAAAAAAAAGDICAPGGSVVGVAR